MASSASGADGAPRPDPPGDYYLSLGDSMAFGIQLDRLNEMLDAGTYSPDEFDTGYTDVLAARMQRLRHGQQTVNLSCPGESTATMIHGGCSFTAPQPDGSSLALHTDYSGPQLDAALSFLRAHPHQVSPITVAIGGNDAGDVIGDQCGGDAECVEQSGLRERLGRNLDRILGALHAAAPDAEIIVVAFHNPFSVDFPGSNGLWRSNYTAAQRDAARRSGAGFVDVFGIIHGPSVCELTFLCTSGDPHPSDAGYKQIAQLIFDGAGYDRL